jgi:phosphoenolpyruvate-protein kinase (PTS system EI component)
VSAFRLESWRANFITRKCITAPAVWLDEAGSSPKLSGAIVITRAADPGHDWIFAHGIAGLITEYGGVASHMSIRAAEFGLPAAIGCGAATVELLQGAKVVELDCASEQVRRVS